MRILLVSRFVIMAAYQRWLEALAAQPSIELVVITPPYWRMTDGHIEQLTGRYTRGYSLIITPVRHNGSITRHYYPLLQRLLTETCPDLLHLDSGPECATTLRGIQLASRVRVPVIFRMEQGFPRQRSLLAHWRGRYTCAHASGAIADNDTTLAALRRYGWHSPAVVIPPPEHATNFEQIEIRAQQTCAFYREQIAINWKWSVDSKQE
jgi:hypothetical protein